MRDSRVGTFGVLGVVCILLLRWAAFLSLTSPIRRGALLLAPALGRWAMVGAVAAFPYARPEGLGKAMHRAAWPFPTLTAAAIALAASLLLFPVWGAALFAFASLAGGLIALYARGRLGGLTGDVAGLSVDARRWRCCWWRLWARRPATSRPGYGEDEPVGKTNPGRRSAGRQESAFAEAGQAGPSRAVRRHRRASDE
jgi:cobalamin synthase